MTPRRRLLPGYTLAQLQTARETGGGHMETRYQHIACGDGVAS